MINKAPPFKGLNIRIPIIIPINGRGLLIRGLGYSSCVPGSEEHGDCAAALVLMEGQARPQRVSFYRTG